MKGELQTWREQTNDPLLNKKELARLTKAHKKWNPVKTAVH